MSSPDLLEIHLHEDPFDTMIKTSGGAVVRGVSRVEVVQSGNGPPRASLSVELSSLQAGVYADRCTGTLDPNTIDVLMRLPARVLVDLARELQGVADDAAEIERHAKAQLEREKPDNTEESP